MALPVWNPVTVNSDRTTAALLAAGPAGFKELGDTAGGIVNDINNRARQAEADARAKLLFDQQQEDRAKVLKEKENTLLAQQVFSDLIPNLQSKDQNAAMPEMASILGRAPAELEQNASRSVTNTGTTTMQVPYTYNRKTALPLPNELINYQVRTGSKQVPNEYKAAPTVFGIPQSVAKPKIEALEKREDALLETPGMYTTRPGSSVRDLSPKGRAEFTKIEAERKEVLRDKSIPKMRTIPGVVVDRQTTFNNLDLSTALTKTGKPAGANVPVNQSYVKDKTTGNLVPLSKAMEAGSKIGQAPTEKVETVVGTKTVKMPGLGAIMSEAKAIGANPEAVKQTYGRIADGYKEVLNLLPKDNSTKRDELRGYMLQVYGNLGLDAKNVDKELDAFLPKIELSDQQKTAANIVLQGLDKQIDQINKDRTFSLQEREFAANQAYRSAELGLKKAGLALQGRELSLRQKESDKYDKDIVVVNGVPMSRSQFNATGTAIGTAEGKYKALSGPEKVAQQNTLIQAEAQRIYDKKHGLNPSRIWSTPSDYEDEAKVNLGLTKPTK